MKTFSQFLAEEWKETSYGSGSHFVRHHSIIDGHYVGVHFEKRRDVPHYDVDFIVDGSISKGRHSSPKILRHVINTVKQFPERYPQAKSLKFYGSDGSEELAGKKSTLYSKLAKHYAGSKASTDWEGHTKVQLKEMCRRIVEKWEEKADNSDHKSPYHVHRSSNVDGRKVDVHFEKYSSSPRYEVSFKVDGSFSKKQAGSPKIFRHIINTVRQFPKKYPHAERLGFAGGDDDEKLERKKDALYGKLAKHYTGDKPSKDSEGRTEIALKEMCRRLVEKWEDPRPKAKAIYNKVASSLKPNQYGDVKIPHNEISFIPHLPVMHSYFSQGDEGIGYPVQRIRVGVHPDTKLPDPGSKQHSLFKDTRPQQIKQTPVTHQHIDAIKNSERLKDVFAHEYTHHADATKALMKGKRLTSSEPPIRKNEKTFRGYRINPVSMKKRKQSYYNDPTEVNAYTSDLFHMAKSSGLPPSNFKSPEDFRKLAIHKAFRTTDDRKYNYTRGKAVKYFTGKNRKKLMRRWRQETGVTDAKAFPNPKPPKEKQLKLPLTGKDRMKLKRQKPIPAATTPKKPEQLRLPIDENRNNPMAFLKRKEKIYHSVFAKYKNAGSRWSNIFDADNHDDARDQHETNKNDGMHSVIIKVPASKAKWNKMSHDEIHSFVQAHIDAKQERKLKEEAPPGAKYERMVKHIKANYSKDGKLSDKEKAIAFATAWKNKKKKQQLKEGLLKALGLRGNKPFVTSKDMSYNPMVKKKTPGTSAPAKSKWEGIINQVAASKKREKYTTVQMKGKRNPIRVPMEESMKLAAKILKGLPRTKDKHKKEKLIAKAQRSMDRLN